MSGIYRRPPEGWIEVQEKPKEYIHVRRQAGNLPARVNRDGTQWAAYPEVPTWQHRSFTRHRSRAAAFAALGFSEETRA